MNPTLNSYFKRYRNISSRAAARINRETKTDQLQTNYLAGSQRMVNRKRTVSMKKMPQPSRVHRFLLSTLRIRTLSQWVMTILTPPHSLYKAQAC